MQLVRVCVCGLVALFVALVRHCTAVSVQVHRNGYIWSSNLTWLTSVDGLDALSMHKSGLSETVPSDATLRIYFLLQSSGELFVSLCGKFSANDALKVWLRSSKGLTKPIAKYRILKLSKTHRVYIVNVGRFNVNTTGYHFLEISSTTTPVGYLYENLIAAIFEGPAAVNLKSNIGNKNGIIRRTVRSLNVFYKVQSDIKISGIYNEMLIPDGHDYPGSYYMCIGAHGLYFGIQAITKLDRRVLFSVWSDAQKDDPNDVPHDVRVQLLRKGPNVITQDFGGEGSGKQSYLKYNWTTGVWYRFLVTAELDGEDTVYSAYFQAADLSQLVASWRKPRSSGQLLSLPSSFVEHFSYDQLGFLKFTSQIRNTRYKGLEDRVWKNITMASFGPLVNSDYHQRYDLDAKFINGTLHLSSGGFDIVNVSNSSKILNRNDTL